MGPGQLPRESSAFSHDEKIIVYEEKCSVLNLLPNDLILGYGNNSSKHYLMWTALVVAVTDKTFWVLDLDDDNDYMECENATFMSVLFRIQRISRYKP